MESLHGWVSHSCLFAPVHFTDMLIRAGRWHGGAFLFVLPARDRLVQVRPARFPRGIWFRGNVAVVLVECWFNAGLATVQRNCRHLQPRLVFALWAVYFYHAEKGTRSFHGQSLW